MILGFKFVSFIVQWSVMVQFPNLMVPTAVGLMGGFIKFINRVKLHVSKSGNWYLIQTGFTLD